MFLKGAIYVTDDEDVVYRAPSNTTRVVSLDEDGVLIKDDSMLVGTCLLPPIEAKIAEADGNEQLYDMCYSNHLLEPYQREFISALLSYLYKGGNLILFLPEIGTNNREKLVQHMYNLYGIHIGLIGHMNPNVANCYYDEKCLPMWINMIYQVNVLSPYEFLAMYPIDCKISDISMQKLLTDINPYGSSIQDKINYILNLLKQLHKNPQVRPAISSSFRRD
jgi:hypothetical protein